MKAAPLRLVVTGGGTGGHVSPALAVVSYLRQRLAAEGREFYLWWLGSADGVERAAAERAGIAYRVMATGKLRRYASAATLVDGLRVPWGLAQAWRELGRLRPELVFSTGGFVSVPAVYAAWLRRIPCLTHEQTVTVGLANRLNARVATVVALSFAASADWLPGHPVITSLPPRVSRPAPLIVTGNPVRLELLAGRAERLLERYGLNAERPIIYVTGGARGAQRLNGVIGELLPELLHDYQIVHQTGPIEANGDLPRLLALAERLPVALRARYRPLAFIGEELPDLFAAASLVIGRAGAGTVNELAALAKPAILVPLAGAADDEQRRNAELLVEAGGAVLLPEAELSPVRLGSALRRLLAEPGRLTRMGQAAHRLARLDATERLADCLLGLVRSEA